MVLTHTPLTEANRLAGGASSQLVHFPRWSPMQELNLRPYFTEVVFWPLN